MQKTCPICKKEFTPKSKANKNAKYCSPVCNSKAYRIRNRARYNKNRREKYKNEYHERIRRENKKTYQKHKEVRKKDARRYYAENKDKIQKANAIYRRTHKKEIFVEKKKHYEDFKSKWYSDLFCDECSSENDLHFHHIDPSTKKHTIARMEWKNSLELLSEIAKCIVLCSSCHHRHHANIRWGIKTCV